MLSKVIISSLCFALFSVETRILFISKQSLRSDSPSFSVIDSESISNRSQYSVSAVSFKEMCNFEIKSGRLTAYIASFAFAPILVALRKICFEMTGSRFFFGKISAQFDNSCCKKQCFIKQNTVTRHYSHLKFKIIDKR